MIDVHDGQPSLREQLGEPDRSWGVGARIPFLECVVVRHQPAERQPPPLRGHDLDLPAQVDLGLQEFLARPAVLVRLAGKAHVVQ